MDIIFGIKECYTAPMAEIISSLQMLNFLTSFSGSASIEDWQDDGEEL